MRTTNHRLLHIVLLLMAGIFAMQAITGCNGSSNAVSPSSSTTKLLVVNTSPNIGPVAAMINNTLLGNGVSYAVSSRTYFRYTSTPVYYSVGTGLLNLQLTTDHGVYLTSDTVTTIANRGYSLFLVGLATKDSLSTVLASDYTPVPTLGNGKVRFLNASPRTPGLDIYVNSTLGFTNVTYKKITDYIELPAGIYDFKMTATGKPSSILTDLSRITVQDGKVYTLYSKGLVGRTDTAAINLNIITNK